MIPAAKPTFLGEEREAVAGVLASGMIAQGPEVQNFEREFASVAGVTHCIAVNSGTSALHCSLLALGIGPGDQVIVPSFTFAATANAVALTGATPIFVDIDPLTYCMDPASAEDAVTGLTRAIIPVHLYGHPANMSALNDIAECHGLHVIEDAAQAHGAAWCGQAVGSIGTLGCFSFYPTKNMTSGEGGMVTTNDPDLARTVRLLRNQGMERRYENEVVGLNNRMTDIHAAIGRTQLRRLATWTGRRQTIAEKYDSELRGVTRPHTDPNALHVYHQYTVRVPERRREDFVRGLSDRGVGAGIYYPTPVHQLPSFDLSLDLPETARAAREVVSIPVYPALTDDEVNQVIQAVNEVAERL